MNKGYKQYLTKEQALQKAKHYCGYQERCHAEVVSKLYELGVSKTEHDEIISSLIEENYLNEERFAKLYAGGKFRMKQWGRVRIKSALKEKRISDYCIKKGMEEIDPAQYFDTLVQLANEKYAALKSEQYLVRKKKTQDYLLQKGYESSLVSEVLSDITKKK